MSLDDYRVIILLSSSLPTTTADTVRKPSFVLYSEPLYPRASMAPRSVIIAVQSRAVIIVRYFIDGHILTIADGDAARRAARPPTAAAPLRNRPNVWPGRTNARQRTPAHQIRIISLCAREIRTRRCERVAQTNPPRVLPTRIRRLYTTY